jgi:hypothetical protein
MPSPRSRPWSQRSSACKQLRGQARVWEHANTLGVAPKRPEPWHVRAAFGDELRQLQKRLNQALNSNW